MAARDNTKRIVRDLKKTADESDKWIFKPIDNNNLSAFYVLFKPKNGSNGHYDGQKYVLQFNTSYGNNFYKFPTHAPNVLFLTPIFHTNISPHGSICLSTLKDEWSPALSFSAIMTSINQLLDDPNVNSPFNIDASHLWSNCKKIGDFTQYDQKVKSVAPSKEILKKYASWFNELA